MKKLSLFLGVMVVLSGCSYTQNSSIVDTVSSEYDSGQTTLPSKNQFHTGTVDSANAF